MDYEKRKKIIRKIQQEENKDVIFIYIRPDNKSHIEDDMEAIIPILLSSPNRKEAMLIIKIDGDGYHTALSMMKKISSAYDKVTGVLYDSSKDVGTCLVLYPDLKTAVDDKSLDVKIEELINQLLCSFEDEFKEFENLSYKAAKSKFLLNNKNVVCLQSKVGIIENSHKGYAKISQLFIDNKTVYPLTESWKKE